MSSSYTWPLLITLPLFLMACDGDRITRTGELERLTFSYAATDGDTNKDRAIAEDANLVLDVSGPDKAAIATMTRIASTNTKVFEASELSRDQIKLRARAAGKATLEVEAILRQDGSRHEDRLSLRVERPVQMSLAHTCTNERGAAYLTGHPVSLEYARFEASGRRLLGEGACNVSLKDTRDNGEADKLASGVRCNESTLNLPAPGVPGTLEVSTNIGSPRDRYQLIHVERVTFGKLDFAPLDESIRVGSSESIRLRPETDNWAICSNLRMRVEILTPHVCEISGGLDVDTITPDDENRIRLRGLESGTCLFEVSLPDNDPDVAWEFDVSVIHDD